MVELHHLPSRPIHVDLVTCFYPSTLSPVNVGSNIEIALNKVNSQWSLVTSKEMGRDQDLHINVKYRVKASYPTPPPAWSSLATDLEKLFLAEESSDVAFEINGEVIPAHKVILTARVPAFENMFALGMKEANSGRIKIDDVDAAAFKQVLRFIYCGKFPEKLDETAESLLPIADKYGIDDLKDACAAALKTCICRDNIVRTLTAAHLCSCPDLKKECIERLADLKKSLNAGDLEMLKAFPDLMVEVILLQ